MTDRDTYEYSILCEQDERPMFMTDGMHDWEQDQMELGLEPARWLHWENER